MIISSSFRCWGKLPIVRSQMSAALLLKRQVCLIRSSLGEISSFLRLPLRSHIRRGLRVLVGGMCETDYSGYPDCRDNTLKSLQVTLDLGLDMPFIIETPLMRLSKAETWALAEHVGGDRLSN